MGKLRRLRANLNKLNENLYNYWSCVKRVRQGLSVGQVASGKRQLPLPVGFNERANELSWAELSCATGSAINLLSLLVQQKHRRLPPCGPQGNAMRVLVIDLNAIITDSERGATSNWQQSPPRAGQGSGGGQVRQAWVPRQSVAANYANFSTPPRSTGATDERCFALSVWGLCLARVWPGSGPAWSSLAWPVVCFCGWTMWHASSWKTTVYLPQTDIKLAACSAAMELWSCGSPRPQTVLLPWLAKFILFHAICHRFASERQRYSDRQWERERDDIVCASVCLIYFVARAAETARLVRSKYNMV